MKLLLIAFSLSVTLSAVASAQAKKPANGQPTPPAQSQPATVSKPLEIPKGAVESEPGAYRYTDPEGKRWIYRKTPFGVARVPEQAAATAAAKLSGNLDEVKAFDEGDTVRFERPGPFGVYQWKARKSDLNENERKVWNRVQSKTAAK